MKREILLNINVDCKKNLFVSLLPLIISSGLGVVGYLKFMKF